MTFNQSAAMELVAEPHVGIFAVAAPDGPPAAVPLWYGYVPGGEIWIVTPTASRKARLVKETGCATLVVDTVTPRVRYASVDLELVGSRASTPADTREIAARYLNGEALTGYLEFAQQQLPDELRMTFRPTKWRFADLTI